MQKTPVLKIFGPNGHHQEFILNEPAYSVGRADGRHRENRLAVSGDPLLSRHHFDIRWNDGALQVDKSSGAKNPVFFQGVESESFELVPGQSFISGKTRFQLVVTGTASAATPTTEYTILRTQFQPRDRPNIDECFRALVELLPGLRESANRETAFAAALKVLRELLPEASEFSVLRLIDEEARILCQELAPGRAEATPPSRRLLSRAFETNGTVTHVWAKSETTDSQQLMTAHAQADWAVASPIEVAGKERFCLYVVGSANQALTETQAQRQKQYLDGLASLIDIVAETLGHHLAVARLSRFEGQVARFFSPALRGRLTGGEFAEVLKPNRRKVTVLFFDLRGFSRATEEAQDDLASILAHHEILTDVMTAVTDCVFAEDGVVVDYQGDAVMAVWGALADSEEADKAVRAATAIVKTIYAMELPFGDQSVNPMRCGLGLATGEVIAGQVGAREQTKFGVLGPTVNLAARLEGLTKYFRVPILLSDDTRSCLDASSFCRRIGKVRPAGLDDVCELHELVLPQELGGSGLSPEEVEAFESASEHYSRGRMNEAYEALMSGSRATDPVGRFLARHTLHHLDNGVPPGFDGVLEFSKK